MPVTTERLRQLAEEAGVNHSIYGDEFSWTHLSEDGMWNLDYSGEQGLAFTIDTEDAEEALAQAFAQVRAKKD